MTEMNDYDENTEDSAVDDEEAKAAESGADSEESSANDRSEEHTSELQSQR